MTEDQALARLHDILARPEYQGIERPAPWWQQLLTPVLEFVWSALARFVQLVLDASSGRAGVLGLGVLVISMLLVVLALVYLAGAVRLSMQRDSEMRTANLAVRRERSDQLWIRAQQLAASGQWAEAMGQAYLSALYALDENALLHVERALTNREHATRLKRANPRLGDSFGELVERYERVRYGSAPVAYDGFEDFSRRAQRVRSAALEGTSTS
jgi:hypothetical protein